MGNPPVTGGFPSQRQVMRSFDVFFDLRPNTWLGNNRDAGELIRHRAHYKVTVMCSWILITFYTPVWKTGRIMPWQCPSVRLSVRLSVRPSVRPGFPDFSSTCFEISIWNLVYTFSRWHDMSSLSCITIGSLWPSLQPKVGQTYFLQSWPHKSR